MGVAATAAQSRRLRRCAPAETRDRWRTLTPPRPREGVANALPPPWPHPHQRWLPRAQLLGCAGLCFDLVLPGKDVAPGRWGPIGRTTEPPAGLGDSIDIPVWPTVLAAAPLGF